MNQPQFNWGSEFDLYLERLDMIDNAKLIARIKAIQDHGMIVAIRKRWVEKLGDNLYEIRADSKGRFMRGIYFQVKDNDYWITHGFDKKTNKTPKKEIIKSINIRDSINRKSRE